MCGRYGFSVKNANEIYERFSIVNTLDDYTPRWNMAPGQMNPVITVHSPKQIHRMFWGLIPHFAKDENYAYKTINARAETVAQLPTFRNSLKNKRCLIPATGFYEPDKINKVSPPFDWHYFQLKSKEMFAFAGLYDVWENPENGNEIYSYTIITTTPNEVVGKIHNRMPVILSKSDEDAWVNPDLIDTDEILSFLKPLPANLMEEWLVGDQAKSPKNDYEDLIKPIKKDPIPEQQSIL